MKQKIYLKKFKIVYILAYGRVPKELELTILGRIAYFIIVLKSVNRCFIVVFLKKITKQFSVQDSVIYALGMLLDFRKAKYTRLRLAYFMLFLFCNISRAWITLSYTVTPFGNPLFYFWEICRDFWCRFWVIAASKFENILKWR